MFDDIVPTYDRLNSIMSLGQDRRLRRLAARSVAAPYRARVLDIGCGTGRLGSVLTDTYVVVGIDVSHQMLLAARAVTAGRLSLVCGSVFRLPFAPNSFDAVVSAFVLRNLDDLEAAFVECGRVLRPGGRMSMIDATEPSNPLWRRIFRAYLGFLAPLLGGLVGHADAYRYLPRSLAHLPPPEEVAALLGSSGFSGVGARRYAGGSVTLWTANRR